MTNSKVRNSDSTCLICFSQVLLKLFTFFVYTQTHTQTNKHKSSFNNKDERATLARATRVVIYSIFVLGPSALGMG